MSNTLYVGGLSFEITEYELQELFTPLGTVTEATVVQDRITGMSLGFGFVTMTTPEEIRNAIGKLSGRVVNGHSLVVSEAHLSATNLSQLRPVISGK